MKKIIIANWKMHPSSLKEAKEIFGKVKKTASKLKKVETVICPPFVYLGTLGGLASKPKRLSLQAGAQDVFWENPPAGGGAHTGEISAKMLKNIGVKYVIIGHSERRAIGETNEIVNKKLQAVLESGMKAVLCIGEKERDSNGEFFQFMKNQLLESVKNIPQKLFANLVITYEPVWAISSNSGGANDNPEDASRMAVFIRKTLMDIIDEEQARKFPVLYGGSADMKNAEGFLRENGIDGLLVGRASLDPKNFGEILKIANSI